MLQRLPEVSKEISRRMDIIAEQERIIAAHLHGLDGENVNAVNDAFLAASRESSPLLEHYGCDLLTASYKIAQKIFLHDATLTDPRQNKLTGLSGLPLFFAGSGEQILASIKAFPVEKPTYAHALWAQQNLYRIAPIVPRVLHAGRASHENGDYFLLVAQFIDGCIVNDLILAMAALPHGEQRLAAREKLHHIVYKIGMLLGRLHTAGPQYFGPQNNLVKDYHQRALSNAVANFMRAPDLAIDENRLYSAVCTMISTMAHHEYRYAYLHGDAHPGNYLYDANTDEVYALDLDNGAQTIGAKLKPLGSPFTDYTKFVLSMKVREIFGVTAQESAHLRQAFDQGYLAQGGTLLSPTWEKFYTVMEVLDYANWYFCHETLLAPEAKIVMQSILQTGLRWLKEICRNL